MHGKKRNRRASGDTHKFAIPGGGGGGGHVARVASRRSLSSPPPLFSLCLLLSHSSCVSDARIFFRARAHPPTAFVFRAMIKYDSWREGGGGEMRCHPADLSFAPYKMIPQPYTTGSYQDNSKALLTRLRWHQTPPYIPIPNAPCANQVTGTIFLRSSPMSEGEPNSTFG